MRTCDPDAYRLLGVPVQATDALIRERYLALSRTFHPDRAGGSAEATRAFQAISGAYRALSEPAGRQAVDRELAIREPSRFAEGSGAVRAAEALAEGLGRLGVKRQRLPAPSRGRDLRVVVTVPFARAALGGDQPVQATWRAVCGDCGGQGSHHPSAEPDCHVCGGAGTVRVGVRRLSHRCGFCGGRGQVLLRPCVGCAGSGDCEASREVLVPIPPRCRDGQLLRVRGQGEAGGGGTSGTGGATGARGGGEPGDLIVDVRVSADPLLQIEGDDVVCALPLTLGQLLRGDSVDVPSLDGVQRLRLPAGVGDGQELRIAGRGLPRPEGGRGDLRFRVQVDVPSLAGTTRDAALAAWQTLEAAVGPQGHRRARRFAEAVVARQGDGDA